MEARHGARGSTKRVGGGCHSVLSSVWKGRAGVPESAHLAHTLHHLSKKWGRNGSSGPRPKGVWMSLVVNGWAVALLLCCMSPVQTDAGGCRLWIPIAVMWLFMHAMRCCHLSRQTVGVGGSVPN